MVTNVNSALSGDATGKQYTSPNSSKHRDRPLIIWTKLGFWAEKARFLRPVAMFLTTRGGADVGQSYNTGGAICLTTYPGVATGEQYTQSRVEIVVEDFQLVDTSKVAQTGEASDEVEEAPMVQATF